MVVGSENYIFSSLDKHYHIPVWRGSQKLYQCISLHGGTTGNFEKQL